MMAPRRPKDPGEAIARRMLRDAKEAGWLRATVRVGGVELIVDDSDAPPIAAELSPFEAWQKTHAR